MDNCDICDTEKVCKKCNKPYELDFDGQCMICPENTFYQEQTKLCRKCVMKNGACTEPECEEGKFFEDASESCKDCGKKCQKCRVSEYCDKCQSGTFYDWEFIECRDCPKNCKECRDAKTCSKCEYPFLLNSDDNCVSCGTNKFYDRE